MKKSRQTSNQSDALSRRSEERRKRIVTHRAKSFEDAEQWDLDFWQKQGPQQRLSALVAMRRDILRIKGSFENVNWE